MRFLRAWLDAVAALPADSFERLRDLGMPDLAIHAGLEREVQRSYWPNSNESTESLGVTANEFEAAVGLLVGFLHVLRRSSGDPYR